MPEANRRLLRYARDNIQTLANNAKHQFASRYALAIYSADAIYSFIPKNACSTMRYTIAIANGAIAGSSDFNWIHANNQTFRASLSELAKAKYTFAILRDPYLRLGSCYLDKMVDQTPFAWQLQTLTNYQSSPATLTFREFVDKLGGHLRGNEHWRPQIDFLVYENYDAYFCIEAFSEAVTALRQQIGLEVRDARDLTRHGTDQFHALDNDRSFADTPAHEIAALKRLGRIPRIAQLYDGSLIAAVGKLYRQDIEFYSEATGRSVVFA